MVQLRQARRRHGAGAANLRLAAALRPRDGGVCLDDIPHNARRRQGVEHVPVGEAQLLLLKDQHRRQHAAGPAGGGRHHHAAAGVLLADGKGVGTDLAVLPGLGAFVHVALAHQVLGLALDAQPAVEHPLGVEARVYRGLHLLPHVPQVVPDFRALVLLHILPEEFPLPLAVLLDFLEGGKGVHILGRHRGLALYLNFAAAHAEHPPPAQLRLPLEGQQLHGVGVGQALLGGFPLPKDFRGQGRKSVLDGHVCQVALPRLGQGAVQHRLEALRLGKGPAEQGGGVGRPHGVGAGRPPANAIQFTQ